MIIPDGYAKAMVRFCISKFHPVLEELNDRFLSFDGPYVNNMPYLDIYAAARLGTNPEVHPTDR